MKKNSPLSAILLTLFWILLTLPMLTAWLPDAKGPHLFGITPAKLSLKQMSLKNLQQHRFQDDVETFTKQHLGGCNYAVRAHNELNYRLFNYSSAPKLILGQKGYFYEDIYLNEYRGIDFAGEDNIRNNVLKFKRLQHQLKQQGVQLLLVIEPSKAEYLPEYLPKGCVKGAATNYETYAKLLKQHGVNFLDLNRYFIEKRSSARHPLYSKHGIHWSTFGLWTAVDTLQRFIECECGVTLPGIIHLGDTFSTQNKDLDFDLEPPMNLLFELPHERLCFPVCQFDTTRTATRNALIIADSYVWGLWNNGILHHWFVRPEFWYYNQHTYPHIWAPDAVAADKRRIPHIRNEQPILLLMLTTANLRNFGWGMLDEW